MAPSPSRKKKSKSSSKTKEQATGTASSSSGGGNRERRKTDAERKFEEIQRERVRALALRVFVREWENTHYLQLVPWLSTAAAQLAERVAKNASLTHKDRVHEFNSKLESLSEYVSSSILLLILVARLLLTVSHSRSFSRI